MRLRLVPMLCAVLTLALSIPAVTAQQPPPFETKKIAEGVYVFRHVGHQAMFVVTPEGVIATDPISPVASKIYLDEIRKITQAPVRYVVYSHHHLDHIAGGAPFKEAGATFVAHRRAKATLEGLKNAATVIPDLVVDDRATLTLGGTQVQLIHVGRNHTDDALVVLVPKEKVLFAVDWIPIKAILFRNVPESFYDEWMEGLDRVLALDWDRLVPGHPTPAGTGTKEDVRALKGYMTDLKDAVKVASDAGKCFDTAMKEVKLPKYEQWGRYNEFLPGNVERLCFYWRIGWR